MKNLLLSFIILLIYSCGYTLYSSHNPIKEKTYKEFPELIVDSLISANGINADSINWKYNRLRVQYDDTTQMVTTCTTLYRLPVDSTLVISVTVFNDTTYILRYRIEKEANIDY